MITLIRQNPALLQPILQQLTQSNPALGQVLASNPQLLAALLTGGEGGAGGEEGMYGDAEEEGEGAEGDSEGETPAQGAADGSSYIQVTPAEREAIERLVSMGFDRARAIEAYFACDKNEELAANYLFDNVGDEDY